MLDAKALAETTGTIVRNYVARALSPIQERLAAIEARKPEQGEPGTPGEPGKNGADGLGFDDMSVDYDGERTFTLKFQQGDRVKEFPFAMPIVLDRGVYAEGKEYETGDGVTWGGQYWIAQQKTSDKPSPENGWRLSVRKGRDGKAAK